MRTRTTCVVTPASPKMVKIKDALRKHGPMTISAIYATSKVSAKTLQSYMPILREAGEIFICEWRKHEKTGNSTAVYSLGPGPDVPKPEALTKSERTRRNRARRKERESAVVEVVAPQRQPAKITFAYIMGVGN